MRKKKKKKRKQQKSPVEGEQSDTMVNNPITTFETISMICSILKVLTANPMQIMMTPNQSEVHHLEHQYQIY
jgi:hypothetical protein